MITIMRVETPFKRRLCLKYLTHYITNSVKWKHVDRKRHCKEVRMIVINDEAVNEDLYAGKECSVFNWSKLIAKSDCNDGFKMQYFNLEKEWIFDIILLNNEVFERNGQISQFGVHSEILLAFQKKILVVRKARSQTGMLHNNRFYWPK